MLRATESTTGKKKLVLLYILLSYVFLYRFMKTPDRRAAFRNAKIAIRNRNRRIARLKKKLEDLISNQGIEVDAETHQEMEETVSMNQQEISALPNTDFRRIFWDQQVFLIQIKLIHRLLIIHKFYH